MRCCQSCAVLTVISCCEQTMAQTLKGQLQQHSKATATLRANIGLLEGKVAEARSKKETLKARALSAQVSPRTTLGPPPVSCDQPVFP